MRVLFALLRALLFRCDFFFCALKRIKLNLALLLKYKIQDVTPSVASVDAPSVVLRNKSAEYKKQDKTRILLPPTLKALRVNFQA